jgi:hypothetical protein
VDGGDDGDGLFGDVDASENVSRLGDARQAKLERLGRQVMQLQEDVVLAWTYAATLANLDGH